ncbi:NAD(FAD)-utilizing dehydrogenase [Micractinium conductrix]|uniref:NAD(FAD)-utilizing dehydrogenase n=1 Tax=Micractinium conductrix TaxID=554055 RepID=A0A2P6VLQ2_9CHLO|nr:NAD(FAD)-utilizing dehydrogenase [Micractinium conductrix]|eukprot:PSC74987.1 NAD(FAD)-utilizing dehydrogenase [Micractinium conductrix]
METPGYRICPTHVTGGPTCGCAVLPPYFTAAEHGRKQGKWNETGGADSIYTPALGYRKGGRSYPLVRRVLAACGLTEPSEGGRAAGRAPALRLGGAPVTALQLAAAVWAALQRIIPQQ